MFRGNLVGLDCRKEDLGPMVNESQLKRWFSEAVARLDDPAGKELLVEGDLDMIDPDWGWSEALMPEAASLYRLVAASVPESWSGVLSLIVRMRDSCELVDAEPHPGLLAPDDSLVPIIYLYLPAYYTSLRSAPREQYTWYWEEDPWGAADALTRVSFYSGRRHSLVGGPEYYNVVAFRRYCGQATPSGSRAGGWPL
jgi:hypothetical protein